MSSLDAQQQKLLDLLRQAGERPLAYAELHAAGISFPAAIVAELELHGYVFEHVRHRGLRVGVRLLHPEPPQIPAARRRWRRR